MAYDPSRIHRIEYNGKYQKFSGYGQLHPSPQRTPVLFQAGSSPAGIKFSAKTPKQYSPPTPPSHDSEPSSMKCAPQLQKTDGIPTPSRSSQPSSPSSERPKKKQKPNSPPVWPDLSNPGSWEDVVELLIPELQRRGIYWNDYAVPGGTFRENMQLKPGQSLLPDDHPGAKLRWNTKKAEDSMDNTVEGLKAVNF